MLGADHAGFLAERWADAFLDCCEAVLGADGRPAPRGAGQVAYRATSPRSACTRWASTPRHCGPAGRQDDVRGRRSAMRELARGRQLIVRVDRTELSKNIVRGLAAYRELLADAAGVARPGGAPRVRLPVARHDLPSTARTPRAVQRARRGDQRRVRHAGLGTR